MEKSSENRTILDIKDLVVRYVTDKETVHAVNGVSLTMEKGEILGLVGETGAGKTTIAKSIMRILPAFAGRIEGGTIAFNGNDILSISEKEMQKLRGKQVSMIFQDPMTALNPIETVGDQIAETIKLHEKCSKAEARKKAVEMLEMVGIPGERYEEFPFQFSGGMKQRVVIALALACNPLLLLADEPTTALDVTIQAQVLEMMRQLQRTLGTSVILITHDLGIVAEMCSKVAVVYAGEIVESGSLEDIFDHTMHPYTIGLFGSIPRLNTEDRRLHPIEGLMPDPTDLPKGCAFCTRCQYAADRCSSEKPADQEVSPGHRVRCFKVQEGAL